jgi:hypothetical protein
VTIRSRSMRIVDLIHKFPYQNSGIVVTRDSGPLHFRTPSYRNLIWPGPSNQGRFAAINLIEGKISVFGV